MADHATGGTDELKDAVRRYLIENFVSAANAATLADDASFLAHGVIDSTGVLELVMFLEAAYGIHIADGEIVPENLDTLDNIARYVRRKLT